MKPQRLALGSLLAALAACQAAPYRPTLSHPTADEISALARTQRAPAAVAQRFELAVRPPIVLAGGAAWVVCYAPLEARRIRYGIEGIRTSETPLEHIENRMLVEHISCGSWLVVCALSNGQRREIKLESRGECNADDRVQLLQPSAAVSSVSRPVMVGGYARTLRKLAYFGAFRVECDGLGNRCSIH